MNCLAVYGIATVSYKDLIIDIIMNIFTYIIHVNKSYTNEDLFANTDRKNFFRVALIHS